MSCLFGYDSFWSLDMLLREEELSVQIGEVNSVQVNLYRLLGRIASHWCTNTHNLDVLETSSDHIFQKLATYTSSAD